MSRGLGNKQRLILAALRSIEAEHGAGDLWAVSFIVHRAYEISEEMRGIERRREQAYVANNMRIQKMADEGDDNAKMYLRLTKQAATMYRRNWSDGGRPRSRDWPEWIEKHLNPSRTLKQLEQRGLVAREPGFAGLTDEGRST